MIKCSGRWRIPHPRCLCDGDWQTKWTEQQPWRTYFCRKKRLFDAETEKPSIDSERGMTSRTVTKEGTEDREQKSKIWFQQWFLLKNGSLCRDTSPSRRLSYPCFKGQIETEYSETLLGEIPGLPSVYITVWIVHDVNVLSNVQEYVEMGVFIYVCNKCITESRNTNLHHCPRLPQLPLLN